MRTTSAGHHGRGRVVVLGSASQDLYVEMERHPTTGETVMGGDLVQRFGGKGGNQAVAAARAGAETLFVGHLGDDAPGRTYRDRLLGHGVDVTRLVLEPDVPTGTALIMLNAARDNMIVVAPGANHHVSESDVAALADLGSEDILLMQMELPLDVTQTAILDAAGRGARVILNLAPYAPLPQDVLDACHLIIVNEKEHEMMQGDGLNAPDVLVTLGTDGSRWGDIAVPAQRVDVVDTTGAGDAYCGALAAALVGGAGRREAMVAATSSSAATVQHLGAQPDPA
ncbi:ribokinase [Tessaracoccus antarcticus]|uniref:Ribokinase n=1 Tax=Tessaracoccus antarcticus TaxID=2479848 RepID=A0A3M0G8F9_9ACTN|nr:ribokinase [Tessaracoccus antarcticus]RMB61255.1 ribokinase [Tessaracoccus antarcticus]